MIYNFAVAEYNPYNQWSPVIFAAQSNLHKLSCKRNLNEKDLKISKGLSEAVYQIRADNTMPKEK
jgi:hypothetical protein